MLRYGLSLAAILLVGEDHYCRDHEVAPEDNHLPCHVFDCLASPFPYTRELAAHPVVTGLWAPRRLSSRVADA